MKIKNLFIIVFISILLIGANLFSSDVEDGYDPGKLAYNVMKVADSHKIKGEIYKAGKVFLEAATLYKKALESEPDNKGYKINFKYCLGTRGFIQIKEGQKLLKNKKFGDAAKYFKWAIDSYKYALKELPNERGFKTNLNYAEYHGGIANFRNLLSVNGKAPDFTIDGFKGGKIDLKNFKGKVILIEFWAGWCPSCKKSMPKLEKLYKRLNSKGFEVIAIAMDKKKTWKKYNSDKKAIETAKLYSFHFGWGDDSTANKYGNFNSIPTVILIDKKGNLIKKVPYKDQSEENLSKLIKSYL